jgi:predicted DNA-binding transcriptional regulator YafY
VDADHAAFARHHLGPGVTEEQHADGSSTFTVEVSNRDAFRSFVLTFLDHAELVGPPALRDDLVTHLEAMVDG